MGPRSFVPILVALLVAAGSVAGRAMQDPSPSPAAPPSVGAAPPAAAVPSPAPDDSGQDLTLRLSDPDFLARARAYTRGNWILFLVDTGWSLLVLAAITFTGISARAWNLIRTRAGEGAAGKVLYLAGLIVFLSLASLPLDYYDGFVREHAYGFSTQTAEGWMLDRIKSMVVTLVLAVLFVVPLFAVIRRFPRTWWVHGAALSCVFATLLVAVAPVFIDPWFNEFTPLKDQDLRRSILDLAHRSGIPADEVHEMDASTRSVHDNAYVAGLLGTQRIVLYDVLLRNYTRDEVAFVMAHEMGHYVLNHVWKGLALGYLLIAAGFWVVHRGLRWTLAHASARTGLTVPGEIATLPLMMLLVSAVLLATLPIQAGWSRHLEREADRFALSGVDHPEAGPGAFRKMAARNLADPDPPALIEWFLYTHPAVGKRIRAAEEHLKSLSRPPSGGV